MRRRLIVLAFLVYGAVVAFGVFGPPPRYLKNQSKWSVWLGGGIRLEDVANVALFVPFGVAFPLLWPRWRWWTIPAAGLLAVGIELGQMAFLSWRSPSRQDVLWNLLGAIVGFTVSCIATWVHCRRP